MFKRLFLVLIMSINTVIFCVATTIEDFKKVDEKVYLLYAKKKYCKSIELLDELIDGVTGAIKKLSESELRNEFDILSCKKYLSFLWSFKAEISYILRNYDEARAESGTALSIDEHNGHAYYVMAYTSQELGNHTMAIVYIKLSAKNGYRPAKEILIGLGYKVNI